MYKQQPQEHARDEHEMLVSTFRHASRLMARAYHQQDHAHHAQGHVLSLIMEKGPMNQGELLEILDVRSSSLSEILSKLERNGYITRERDETDKRRFIISATSKANEMTGNDIEARRENAQHLFSVLSDEERTQLQTILNKIVTSLKDEAECRGRHCKRHRHDHHGHGGDCGHQNKRGFHLRRGRHARDAQTDATHENE